MNDVMEQQPQKILHMGKPLNLLICGDSSTDTKSPNPPKKYVPDLLLISIAVSGGRGDGWFKRKENIYFGEGGGKILE